MSWARLPVMMGKRAHDVGGCTSGFPAGPWPASGSNDTAEPESQGEPDVGHATKPMDVTTGKTGREKKWRPPKIQEITAIPGFSPPIFVQWIS